MKTGDYLELRVPQFFTYAQVAAAAATAVGLQSESEAPLALIRANKTVVPNAPLQADPESGETVPWTVWNYLSTFSSFKKSKQTIKLGIAYQVSEDQAPGNHSGM